MIVTVVLLVLVVAGTATLAVILMGRSSAGGAVERDLDAWRARPSIRETGPRRVRPVAGRRIAA